MSRVIKNDDGVVVVEGTPASTLVKDSDKFFASKPPERMAGESISQPKKIDPRAINTRSPFQRKSQSERTDEERRANLEAFDRLSEERKREMTINTREPTPSKKPVEDKARYIGGSKDFNERTGRVEPSEESARGLRSGRGRGRRERRQITPKERGFTDERKTSGGRPVGGNPNRNEAKEKAESRRKRFFERRRSKKEAERSQEEQEATQGRFITTLGR